MSNRVKEVVDAVVEGIRGALVEKNVTHDEYRAALMHLAKTAEAKEIPLLIDVFLNITIVEIQNAKYKGTRSDLQGPYYLPDAPFVEDEIKTMEEFDGEPMRIQGQVTDVDGNVVEGAVLDIWQSTPDGKYSGIHDNIPVDYYRGKVKTDSEGRYSVKSTIPVPYQIPNNGPTGELIAAMGTHSWRPAHIHFKVNKEGYHDLTMQAYFEGGDYVDDDCCSGLCNEGVGVIPEKYEGDVRIMDVNFVVDYEAA